MKFAPKWQASADLFTPESSSVRHEVLGIGDGILDVVHLGEGDPLILVPGMAGSWNLLLPLAKTLARHFHVITYGLRDDGFPWKSRGRQNSLARDISQHADDLSELIDRLGFECPSILGVSFGAAIALEMAVEHPHKVGSLIVNGAGAHFPSTIGSRIARRVLERFPLPADSHFINQFFNLLYATKPEPGHLTDFVTDRIWDTDQSVIARRLALLEAYDVSDRLWRISAPTLVLAGARDVIVPADQQLSLAKSIAGARFETIPDAGHIGFLTHSSRVLRSLKNHLQNAKAIA
jgi:pimeloyl-ACP methyl ester carboxylesterase